VQYKLLGFLKKKFEQKHRVSVERVVSGPGICNV
jgi:glucokinase